MKTFKKTNLNPIIYRGRTYTNNIRMTGLLKKPKGNMEHVEMALTQEQKKGIIVECMHPNLVGKNDLFGKPYQPTVWIFTAE